MRLISDEALAVITIWQEANGEPYIGKVAVGEVILRRKKLKLFSDGSIAGTVAHRKQFSGWNDDPQNNALLIRSLRIDDSWPQVQACVNAWREAVGGSSYSNGATHYFNPKIVTPAWAAEMIKVASIGNHDFYRLPSAA